MKHLYSALALAMVLSQAAMAGTTLTPLNCAGNVSPGSCNGPTNQVCAAVDANGRSYRFYLDAQLSPSYGQRAAVGECQSQSASPGSCRAAGCHFL